MAKYRRHRKVDVTTLAANKSSAFITSHINNRYDHLISQVGGPDYFEPIELTIKHVNRLNNSHFTSSSSTQFDLAQKIAKSVSTASEYDWEAEASQSSGVTNLKDGVNVDELDIYMIIIEYTQIKEVAE